MASNTNYGALKRTIKSKNPQLLKVIEDSWPYDHQPVSFLELVYQFPKPTDIICPYGNKKKFEYYRTGYICKSTCACSKEKRINTLIERYGVQSPLQSAEIKERMANTLRDRYGTDVLSRISTEKRKQTNTELYGSEHPLQSPSIRDKARRTHKIKHGTDYPFQKQETQFKAKSVVIDRYGVDSVLRIPENRDKASAALMEKYGTDNLGQISALEGVHQKMKESILSKYGVPHVSQRHIDPDKLKELHDDDRFIERYANAASVAELEEYFGVKASTIHHRASRLNLPRKRTFVSSYEQEVVDFLKQYTTDIVQSDRSVISPKEIDIVIPSLRIGIEFDGIYHHSDQFIQDKNFHLSKTLAAQAAGFRLIHIFSDEWLFKQDIVKSRLLHITGISSDKIYARKCQVCTLSYATASQFLIENHIQGTSNSSINFGLYYNNNLVAVMTFGKPRFNKKYDYELIRYCSKVGTTVVGGPSKLLKHFTKTYTGSIISYADKRWSEGNLYKQLGFRQFDDSGPNYYYVVGQRRESRNKYQKHKLSKLLQNFDPLLSERENMRNNGFYRVFDCGNSVWVYENKKGEHNDE